MSDSPLISPLNQVSTDILTSSGSRLESRIHAAKSAPSTKQRGELKKAAQEFEAVFIAHMLKVMRETIEESGLMEGGFGKSIYTELFDQEVSLGLAKRGALGISNLLERSLLANIDVEEEQNPAPSPVADPEHSPSNPVLASPDVSGKTDAQEPEITDLQLPVHAPISSYYGMRKDPFSKQAKFHKGLDLAAPEGMKVVPALPGKVVSAGYENGYGNTVLVEHSGGLQTRYAHLGSISVSVGDAITSQNVLGTVGNTGRSTGSHLHFEVIRNGSAVNPSANLDPNKSVSDMRSEEAQMGG
jgi:murein DD-endopeptidase MepM/ murein hydrolase activator NlpD